MPVSGERKFKGCALHSPAACATGSMAVIQEDNLFDMADDIFTTIHDELETHVMALFDQPSSLPDDGSSGREVSLITVYKDKKYLSRARRQTVSHRLGHGNPARVTNKRLDSHSHSPLKIKQTNSFT